MELVPATLTLLVLSIATSALLNRWRGRDVGWLWFAYLAHVLAAFAQVYVVRRVYGSGDMVGYQRVGTMISRLLIDYPADTLRELAKLLAHADGVSLPIPLRGGSTGAMLAISGIAMTLVHGSLVAGCLFVAIAAFAAGLLVMRVAEQELPEVSTRALAVAVLGVPSAVFWSSGLLKEGVAMVGLGLAVHGGYNAATRQRVIRSSLELALGMVLVGIVKAYLLLPFGAAAGYWLYLDGSTPLATRRTRRIRPGGLVVGAIVTVTITLGVGQLFPRFSPSALFEEASRLQGMVEVTSGRSDYEIGSTRDSGLMAQLANVPEATATALFRPFPTEIASAQMALTSLEVLALALALLAALARSGLFGSLSRMFTDPPVAFALVFALGVAVGVGLGTTNLGTLARYRAPLLPFYGLVIVALLNPRKRALAQTGGLHIPTAPKRPSMEDQWTRRSS